MKPKEIHDDPVVPADEQEAFRDEVDDVTPLTRHGRYQHPPASIPPLPLSLFKDERQVIYESLHDPVRWDEAIEANEDASYVRPGLSMKTLRSLRRGEWVTQAELDLHGLTRVEAKHELAEFLAECKRRGIRCVRIIHGKGLRSPNREPVLKIHVRHWLIQRIEVLAFVSARPVDGGEGAVVVLLRGR